LESRYIVEIFREKVEKTMERSKLIAIITGAIAIALSVAYLLLVQILDFRGMMAPAPIDFN
jgi:hypothetical protein